jgi:HAD superfamily hydrolase (TIGR01662 family)
MTLFRFTGDWVDVIERGTGDLAEFLADHGMKDPELLATFSEQLRKNRQDRLVDHIERPTAELLQDLLRKFEQAKLDKESLEQAMRRFYRASEQSWIPSANLHDVLKGLQEAGYQMALLSNAGDTSNVHRLLERANLKQYFDIILISASEGIRKPNSKLFQKIASEWQLPEEQIVMVGDSLEQDIQGAQQVGMHQIWLYENISKDEALHEAKGIDPEASAAELADIPILIKRMN